MQRVHSLWVCFTPEGVIQNGSIFKSRTHTSGHFLYWSHPPLPPPPGKRAQRQKIYILLWLGSDHQLRGGGGLQDGRVGGPTKREGGHVKFYPYEKGGGRKKL